MHDINTSVPPYQRHLEHLSIPSRTDSLPSPQVDILDRFQGYSQCQDNPDFSVVLGDGTLWESAPGLPPRFMIRIHDPDVLSRLLAASNDLVLAEAFLHNQLDIDGDLEAAYSLADFMLGRVDGNGFSNPSPPTHFPSAN